MHVYLPPNPMSDASDREDDEDSVAVADENSEDRMWCYLFGLGEKTLLVQHIRDGDYAAALKTADEPLRKLHNAEWPNNTWNGQSIF